MKPVLRLAGPVAGMGNDIPDSKTGLKPVLQPNGALGLVLFCKTGLKPVLQPQKTLRFPFVCTPGSKTGLKPVLQQQKNALRTVSFSASPAKITLPHAPQYFCPKEFLRRSV